MQSNYINVTYGVIIFQTNREIFGPACIKAFLTSFVMDEDVDYKRMWKVVKHLSLKVPNVFGVNLSEVVKEIEMQLWDDKHLILLKKDSTRTYLDTKASVTTEIAVAKGVLYTGKTAFKLSSLSMKHLWSLIVQCFDQFVCLIQSRTSLICYNVMLEIKEALNMFLWIEEQAHSITDMKTYEEDLIMLWSIGWCKLKQQLAEGLNIGRERNDHEGLSITQNSSTVEIIKIMEEISEILNTHLQQFSFKIRRFWEHLGFSKVKLSNFYNLNTKSKGLACLNRSLKFCILYFRKMMSEKDAFITTKIFFKPHQVYTVKNQTKLFKHTIT